MEGAIISLGFFIAISIFGGVCGLSSVGFKLIKVLTDLNNTLKQKSQSKDCEESKFEVKENDEVNKQ